MVRTLALMLVLGVGAGCTRAPAKDRQAPPSGDARVRALADRYLDALLERNPDQITYLGLPNRHHDRLPDNSLPALEEWHRTEDRFSAEALAIDPASITTPALRATFAIARESLDASKAARVCRNELWTVSQMVNGWPAIFGYLVTIQLVGTDQARDEALARWGSLPAYIDREIDNLREGLKRGYSAPKGNVRIVIAQMDTLSRGPLADSPFDSPSVRDRSPEFVRAYDRLVRDQIVPALRRYHDFLEHEYLPAAREAVAVSSNPDGAACYDASVRYHSSVAIPASEVHQTGLREIAAITAEMQEIARRAFQTNDVPALLQRLRTDRQFLFKDRAELIGYSQAALARAKKTMPAWFGLLPHADVVIEPYPKFREQSGPNEYNPPAEDGSRPAVFFISAYQAETRSRAGAESTAFHETIPGHHLQGAIALERKEIHPLGRYFGSSGYLEGWGLYTERLADEMKLYSGEVDRMGMLSDQALRAARLVVDSGLHRLGWSRQQAIDYMLEHTTETAHSATSEVDRYIIYPGQATAYMLGALQIRRARAEAEAAMGSRFSVKAFHDRVLEDGAVPLGFLTAKIKAWTEGR